jgi:acylphosphatase
MPVRAHVYVSGKVQGVWFRANTQTTAEALGLTGWVRNLQDGRVEAAFEGDEKAVARMVNWCKHGPETADVEHIDVHHEAVEGLAGFRLRPTL